MGARVGRSAWRLSAALLLAAALAAASASAGAAGPAGPAAAAPGATAADSLYAAWRPLLARTVAAGGEPRDVYKLVFQGAMGPAHAAPSKEEALDWLRSEWAQMEQEAEPPAGAGPQPLLEPIRPDSQLVRVHLRPLLRRLTRGVPERSRGPVVDAALERLAVAFQRTAETWRGDLGIVRQVWGRAVEDEDLWGGLDARRSAAALTAELEAAHWPAVHHSDAWTARHAPHYRVVARSLLPPSWRRAAEGSDR